MINFNDDWRQAGLNNAVSQLNNCPEWMQQRMIPPEILELPSYYFSNVPTPPISYSLENDSNKALELALNTYLPLDDYKPAAINLIQDILYSWSINNKGVNGWQAKFELVYKGSGLIDAFRIIKYNINLEQSKACSIRNWIRDVYLPLAESLKNPWYSWLYKNNINSWGWCGYLLAKDALGVGITKKDIHKFEKFIKTQIGTNGKMKKEVWRTYSFLWYTYFNLMALTRAALLLSKTSGPYIFYSLMDAYSWFGYYCRSLDPWPYKPWPWIFGKLERLIFPCANEPEYPNFNGRWPSDLLETIYSLGYNQNWIANSLTCPIDSGTLFRNSTALRAFGLTEKVYMS
jgi:hypothetical protein